MTTKNQIHFDEFKYKIWVEGFEFFIPTLEEIVSDYAALNLTLLQPGELSALFFTPKEFIFDKMTEGEPIIIGKNEIDKAKAMDILKKPKGYERLLGIIDLARQKFAKAFEKIRFERVTSIQQLLNYFECNDAMNVTIKESTIQQVKEKCTIYAETELTQSVLEFAQNLHKMFIENKFYLQIQHSNNAGHEAPDFLKNLFKVGENGFEIDKVFISSFNTFKK
jgi:hypothetical protein